MKSRLGLILFIMLGVLSITICEAQKRGPLFMDAGNMTLRIELNWSQAYIDSVLKDLNMMPLQKDTLLQNKVNAAYQRDGWKVARSTASYIELSKTLGQIADISNISAIQLASDSMQLQSNTFYPYASFGYNAFKKKQTVKYISETGLHRFYYYSKKANESVRLSGSFVAWSPSGMQMQYNDTAYWIDVKLAPGKHLYKFIINGHWIADPENKNLEDDSYGNRNSVYFACNKTFVLQNFSQNKKVVLTGSFNNWDEQQLSMTKVNEHWEKSIFVEEGTYAYKYILDGRIWITDPTNPLQREDGEGNVNSIFSFGDTSIFQLKGFANAKNVYVAGSFNAWRPYEIKMKKTAEGWEVPYVLGPGMYQYKFIVDDKWILDPSNKLLASTDYIENSVHIVGANHTFSLAGFDKAKNVFVSGSFINWFEPGLQMNYSNGKWTLPVHLHRGKQSYKFIVDGEWIQDPANPLYDTNQYGGKDSFIWHE
jgi:hypothetical protein